MAAEQKTCEKCGQPMLAKGQRRKHVDDYRHARGCPNASKAEREQTERMWAEWDREEAELKQAKANLTTGVLPGASG